MGVPSRPLLPPMALCHPFRHIARARYRVRRLRAIGRAFAVVGLLAWGGERGGSKIGRGGAAWVLKGGRHFVNTCNNQIKLVKAMEGESVRTRGWGGTRGGALFRRFGRRNKLTKNKREGDGVVALDGRC